MDEEHEIDLRGEHQVGVDDVVQAEEGMLSVYVPGVRLSASW